MTPLLLDIIVFVYQFPLAFGCVKNRSQSSSEGAKNSKMVDIIVYSYEMAPNPQKLFQFLSYFNIPFKYVEIPEKLPRPDFTSVGITYRRAPLLSIDSDMYVDTALIITKLADIAAHTGGGGGKDGEAVDTKNHLEFDGLGQAIFKLATGLLPPDHALFKDEAFMKDRSELHGGAPFDPKVLAGARPQILSGMMSHLSLLERTFLKGDGSAFILGGSQPTTADMYLYWSVNWGLRYHDGARPEISPATYPVIFDWLSRVEHFLSGRRRDDKISWSEAQAVLQRPPKHEYAKFVPHDASNPLKLESGAGIRVTPTDSGKSHPQAGTLISLNRDQVCLRNAKGLVMHFPRIGYTVEAN